MAAIDFPSSPVNGQQYTNPATGQVYTYSTSYSAWQATANTIVGYTGSTGYSTLAVAPSGTGSGIFVPATSKLEFGANNFTMEFFWYPNSTSRQALYHGSSGADYSLGIDYSSVGTNKLGVWASSTGSSWDIINADGGGNGIGTTTVPQNQWNHIAFVRNGTSWKLYLNGVADVSITSSSSIFNRVSFKKAIGQWYVASGAPAPATGFISNFRVVNGVAVYTTDFTPPIAPLSATVGLASNTVLLTAEGAPPSDRSPSGLVLTGNNLTTSIYSTVGGSATLGYTGSTGGVDYGIYYAYRSITF